MKWSEYQLIFIRLLLAVILIMATRLVFLVFNSGYFSEAPLSHMIWPFFYGLKFDLATALIFNIPFLFLVIVPFRHKFYELLIQIVFCVMTLLCVAINLIDTEYFQFNGKRLTVDIFSIGSDMADQIPQLALYYWYIPLSIILIGGLTSLLYRKIKLRPSLGSAPLWSTPFLGLLVLVISFIGIRGGLQMRSMSTKQAFVFEYYQLGNLVLNSGYTLVRSLDDKETQKVNLLTSDKEALDKIYQLRSFRDGIQGENKENIVLIIIESLAQEYMDQGFTPFISQIASKGLFFSENYANGRRSIEALPSILVGVPSILDKPISQSKYQTNYFLGLPRFLSKLGYESSFFHGGKTGTMDFDSFTRSIGIKKYYGREDYTGPDEHFDGAWGIYDHYFLNFMLEELSRGKKPFFSTIFTLSSHQPYALPAKFEGKFPKGSLEIHESIGYVDYALKLFFEKAKKEDWYENTLFVITADHTQKTKGGPQKTLAEKYRVPLIFYHPFKELNSTKKITQHVDIVPSLMDYVTDLPEKKLLFGSSVFNEDVGLAFNYNNILLLAMETEILESNFKSSKLKSLKEDELDKKNIEESLLNQGKALYQYGINGLINNSLYR